MLFGTGPSGSSSVGAGAGPYSLYSHPSEVGTGQAPSFKSLHPALMSSMLHASSSSNPNGPSQSELIASLNTYHHHQHNHQQHLGGQQQLQNHIEGVVTARSISNAANGGNLKSSSNSCRESPGAHRTQTASPSSSGGGSSVHPGSQNEVRTCMLYGIPIVSLVMDGQERLCLAQISNTLLKSFSYNEIHNRRVALGITCVQCTPVQLELLRRAGAMPVSSRRCGMITKRESERLCKSFLAEAEPPKLPDSFAFDVYHSCAWGCRGSFTPSRYNSSRAKCIKCIYCGLFFSPNKFIFHSHRLPTSKYIQPDAANFNSWRRHIRLVSSPEPPEHVSYAWEDVKAMFNGGSRKRAMSSTLNSFTKNQESNFKANAASKHEQANKYKYSDDNSGLDDSDDYCSLDEPPQAPPPLPKKMTTSEDSDQGTNSGHGQMEQELEEKKMNSPLLHCSMGTAAAIHHPYHPFAQINSKSLFESHFKKAFEVNSMNNLVSVGQSNSMEQTGNSPLHHQHSSSLVSTSPIVKQTNSNETSESTKKTESMMMGHSPSFSPQSSLCPPGTTSGHGAYLAAGSEQQATLMASYNGLFGHPFARMQGPPLPPGPGQLSDTRMHSGTGHPAILSTLLNGMPESAMTATQQLRAASGLLSSNYITHPMAPNMINTQQSPSAIAANSTTLDSPISAQSTVDFRHNMAEFMWSMAASKAGPTPYSFFWPAAVHPPNPSVMMTAGAAGSSLGPLGTTSQTSSSASSTPTTLSPNHGQETSVPLQESSGNGAGGIFDHFKSATSANADEIRKALLLNSGLALHNQQRNVAHFPQLHPNAGMPFLPNLIGHNLRLMPPNGAHSGPTNYMLNKENSQVDVSSQNKSPELLSGNISAMPAASLPFPFRSAFTSPTIVPGGGCAAAVGQHNGTALDRFSSETLLRNQALLFDAYHGGNAGSSALSARAAFFNPSLFSSEGKQRYEESCARDAERAEKQSVDVTGMDVGETAQTASMLRSMYHSFTTSAAKSAARPAVANGSTKFSRRNLKRTSQDSNVGNNKKINSSSKGKSSPKKVTKSDVKIASVQKFTFTELNESNKNSCNIEVVVDGSSSSDDQKKETEQNSHDTEILCDVEESVESAVKTCENLSKSTSSPKASQNSSDGSSGTMTFHHQNDTVSPVSSHPSPSNSSSSINQTPAVASMQLVL